MERIFTGDIENITIGADPEVFVKDNNGRISSVIGALGGTKETPRLVSCGGVQEDNVLAEFNIDPSTNAGQFTANISEVMSQLSNILRQKDLRVDCGRTASHNFDMDFLKSQGEKAMEFGCSSEWNTWTKDIMKKPDGESTTLRTAGGHIHIGYDDPIEAANYSIVKLLDFQLGLPSVLKDKDTQRRSLYGQAGSMRHKPYGVEYRTLSNFWLRSGQLVHSVGEIALNVGTIKFLNSIL